ncbi:MAG TPA: STAS domain-containing protein [Mycobacteriales bacterium]|nr:STAS domain-containing protein [Mycobacteriales bacterium]
MATGQLSRPSFDSLGLDQPSAPVAAGPDGDAAGFRVDVRTEPGRPPALVLAGEIDVVAALAITATADRLLFAAAGTSNTDRVVLLQLARVTFLDCAALGALVGLQHRLDRAGGRLVVEDVSRPALRLLTLTRHTHQLLPEPAGGIPSCRRGSNP